MMFGVNVSGISVTTNDGLHKFSNENSLFCTFYELNYVYFAKISEKKCNFASKIMSKGNVSVRLIERLMLGIIVLFVFGPMSAQTKRVLVICPFIYYISQVLATQKLSASTDWILDVKKKMDADGRLTRQNMVYESSIK
jgi:hypothetical protein